MRGNIWGQFTAALNKGVWKVIPKCYRIDRRRRKRETRSAEGLPDTGKIMALDKDEMKQEEIKYWNSDRGS